MINRFLRQLTVPRRIIGGFLVLLLLLVLSILLIVANQSFLLNRLQQITDVERTNRSLLFASARIASSRVNLARYVQDYTPSTYEAQDDIEQAIQFLAEVEQVSASSVQKESVNLVLDALAEYKNLIANIETARLAGESHEVTRLQFQAFRLGNDIGQRIELIVKDSEAQVEAVNEAVRITTQRRFAIFAGLLIGGALLALLLATLVTRSITRPVAELRAGADAFRSGHMDTVIPVVGSDELSLLAQTFNQLVSELSELYRNLEQRVVDRTRRLEWVAILSERLVAILNLEELLEELVNQIKENFGYYHAHIYLVDDKRQQLVVAAGTGDAGQVMKAKGHSISLDAITSLVARAARSYEIVRVDNVREADDWLPNPLLPYTHAEMAVPITLEGQIVGVLDVQSDEVGGLDEGDANLLRSLANHVAIAIRNARLFNEVETALAEARTAQEQYLEQAWRLPKSMTGGLFHFTQPDAPAITETVIAKARQYAFSLERPTVVSINDKDTGSEGDNLKSIVSSITLGEVPIGTLQLHPLRNDQTWTEDDLAVVEAVVQELAQTAEKLRLFEDTRQRATREQITRQITDKMRSAPDAESIIQTGLDELAKALGVSRTYVKLTAALERQGKSQTEGSGIEPIRATLEDNGRMGIASASPVQNEEGDASDQVEEI